MEITVENGKITIYSLNKNEYIENKSTETEVTETVDPKIAETETEVKETDDVKPKIIETENKEAIDVKPKITETEMKFILQKINHLAHVLDYLQNNA